jgi:hypothetical protein
MRAGGAIGAGVPVVGEPFIPLTPLAVESAPPPGDLSPLMFRSSDCDGVGSPTPGVPPGPVVPFDMPIPPGTLEFCCANAGVANPHKSKAIAS